MDRISDRTFLGMLAEWHSRTPPYDSLKNRKLVVMNVMSESRAKKLQSNLGETQLASTVQDKFETHFRHLKSDEVMCFGVDFCRMNLRPLMSRLVAFSRWRGFTGVRQPGSCVTCPRCELLQKLDPKHLHQATR